MSTIPHKRIAYGDIAKGLGIIMVVMEHDHFVNTQHVPWQVIILSFHMPLFYFISGVFFNPSHGFNVHLARRFHSLLKPYFTVCCLFVFLLLVKNRDLLTCGRDLAGIIYGTGRTLHWSYGALWFLPSLFCTTMCYFFLNKYLLQATERTALRWSIFFSFLVLGYGFNLWFRHNSVIPDLPWSINLVFITTFFYGAGYEFRRFYTIRAERLSGLLFAVALVIMGVYSFVVFSDHFIVLNFFYKRYDNLFVNTLEALSAVYVVLYISKAIEKKSRLITDVFAYVGKKSLTIFMFHSLVLTYVSGIINHFMSNDGIWRFLLTVIITVVLCSGVHEVLWRIPVLSNLFLNRKT